MSELIDRVEHGETFTLTRHGNPVSRIVPFAERQPGLLSACIGMAPGFDETPDWLVEAFRSNSAEDDLLPR